MITRGDRQGESIALAGALTIGRDASNALALNDARVSRNHARIEKRDEHWILQDLDSTNGTYVNGKLTQECVLKEGDEILVGSTCLKVTSGATEVFESSAAQEVRIIAEEPSATRVMQSMDLRKTTFLDVEGRAMKIEQMKKTVRNLSILYKSGNVFSAILDAEALLAKILDLIMEVIRADRYVVLLKDEKTHELVPKIIRRGATQAGFYPVAISNSIVDTVMKENVGVICAHAGQDGRFMGSESVLIYGIKSAMCVPISILDKILGLIYCDSLTKTAQFEQEDLKMLGAIAAQAAIALENARLCGEIRDQERLRHELAIAREIQQILLPKVFPKLEHFDTAFHSVPAEEVGGDHYDWFWINEEKLALVIADVSGKGIPGALVATMFRSALRSRALNAAGTSDLLRDVNNLLIPDMKQDMFVSAVVAFLDTTGRKLVFSRAGHLPLVVFRASQGRLEEHLPEGMALGLSLWKSHGSLREEHVELEPGDCVFFFTDGVEENRNASGELFGRQRFFDLILRCMRECGDRSASELVRCMINDVVEFSNGLPPVDDITLGILKVGNHS